MESPLHLQEWVYRISLNDRRRLVDAFADPREFNRLMEELREKYNFIPDPSGLSDGTE